MTFAHYIGIPYKDHGRDPRSGLDCWGLVKLMVSDLKGIDLPDYMELYGREDGKIENELVRFKGWERVQIPHVGDILLFRITDESDREKGRWWHAGVSVGGTTFIHTLNKNNSCVDRIDSIRWRDRYVGAFRWTS